MSAFLYHSTQLTIILFLVSKYFNNNWRSDEGDENGDNSENSDDDDEEDVPKIKPEVIGRRTPPILLQTTITAPIRTTKKRPLECYICAHKPDTLLRACLDPTKFR